MAEHIIILPDIGEGIAEAELVSWLVREGESVKEDQALAEIMTDKATIEIPSPIEGVVTWLGAAAGDKVRVGSPIVRLQIGGAGAGEAQDDKTQELPRAPAPSPEERMAHISRSDEPPPKVTLAAPAVRARAKALGVDLVALAPGSGPDGRITDADLNASVHSGAAPGFEDIRIIGVRRKIAEKMTLAASRIPHITYVEEVDVTALEAARARLNAAERETVKLTLLPFLVRALALTIAEQPNFNAHYLDDVGILRRFRAIHAGIATQTDGGLLVPVLRDAQALDLASCAAEIARLTQVARSGAASRDELTGSTITITSLGALGGLVTTPIINHPEVAIVGVNKMRVAPVWDGAQFLPRTVMNISASFDHRVIDGWDAARFVQRIKALLEAPDQL